MCSSNSAKKLSLDSSKWTAAETLLNVKKSYISEAASRKTSQNVMTYRKIPWQLDMDSYSVPNYQGISYFCYCLSGCDETVWSCNQISIQLLLLFILILIFSHRDSYIFQYNSCYCLSRYESDLKQMRLNFNTTLVTVYQCSKTACSLEFLISIQLLLLFIRKPGLVPGRTESYFNTTLVTVYHETGGI